MSLRLRQLEVGGQGDLVVERVDAVRELHLPVHPEGGAIDRGLALEPDLLADGAEDRAGQRDGELYAAELALALDRDGLAVAGDRGRLERDARELLVVEELGREQMALEVLVLHGDAGDVRRAADDAV